MPSAKDVTPSTWDWSGSHLERDGKSALLFNVIPSEILFDEDGEVRGFVVEFRFTGHNREINLPASVMRASRPNDVIAAAGGPDLQLAASKTIVAFLDDIRIEAASLGIPTSTVTTRARWDGDVLNAPGMVNASGKPRRVAEWVPELAAYGMCAEITEEKALQSWAEIVRLALTAPKAMMVYGMPIGSIYCDPLKADSFAMHITSESSMGKTESAEIAMSALSSARRPHGALYRTWDASAQAPTNLLKMTGPLPVWFDETAVFGGDDVEFTNLLFRLAQGRGRLIANTEGGLRAGSGERWDACVLSTGEARVSNRSGLTGLRRRVIEIYAPLIDHRGTHEEILDHAQRAHGWPLRWLVADPHVAWARGLYLQVFAELSHESQGQQLEVMQAANLAVCMMGFGILARLAGVKISPRQLVDAGRKVFSKILASSEDEGSDIGERGLRAIREAVLRTGSFYRHDDEMFGYQRFGVYFPDGYVGIIGQKTLAEILKTYAGLDDPVPVLERWAASGVLQHDQGRHTGRRKIFWPGQGVVKRPLYLIDLGSETDKP